MNILFVNYGDFTTNSLNHIGGFANTLTEAGHACIVAVPEKKESLSAVDRPLFMAALFEELLAAPTRFPDGRAADVVHVWTPRENVRRFALAYLGACPASTRLFIHLEDNEDHLIEAHTGAKVDQLRQRPLDEVQRLLPLNLSHPTLYRDFLQLADGVTVIIDRLKEFVPAGIPTHLLQPGVDFALYGPGPADETCRQELGLEKDETVIVFTGSTTFANEPEMRNLYVGVAKLNRLGHRTRLIRTGFSTRRFVDTLTPELREHVLNLGFVPKHRLPALLRLADFLIQPGGPGAFNDYRLPSKIPEFLAVCRPVIMPDSNVAKQLEAGVEAIILPQVGPEEIAASVIEWSGRREEAEAIGRRGGEAAKRHFALDSNTRMLLAFYENIARENTPRAGAEISARRLGCYDRLLHFRAQGEQRREHARVVKQALDSELAARRKVEELEMKVSQLQGSLHQREDKLSRVLQSGSWRHTAIFRALRRKLLDPQTSGDMEKKNARGGRSESDRLYDYEIETPRAWTVSAKPLAIQGWCYEANGEAILGVRARLGKATVEGRYGERRPDVLSKAGGSAHAEFCEFKIELSPDPGESPLFLDVRHKGGWSCFHETRLVVRDADAPPEMTAYEKWCAQHEALSDQDRLEIEAHIRSLETPPRFSLLMPVFNPPVEFLRRALQSVNEQLYPHWELCIADDASTNSEVRTLLEGFAARDPSRIKLVFRESNGHISAATNTALDLATGEFVGLFDHDDLLHPLALYECAAAIGKRPDLQFIYTDEDKVDAEERRFDPYFKPDWNPELLLGQNYTCHFSVFRRDRLKLLGGMRLGFEGSQDWDLTLRYIENLAPEEIHHIPKVLYHWRAIPGSTALLLTEKSYPIEAGKRAVAEHFERLGIRVSLEAVAGGHWVPRYPLPDPVPLVSLIIPTRNAWKLVDHTIKSILTKTTYKRYEVVLIDNGSDEPESLAYLAQLPAMSQGRVRVLRYDAPFNYSAINNFAVENAAGEVVGLVNNDIEVITGGWLEEMVSLALRPGTGAVGAKLIYPDGTLQHAGVILGLGGVAGHPFKGLPREASGPMNRLRLVQNLSAVTAACLIIKKDRYHAVNGLDADHLAVAFNDIDFCCRLLEAGFRNVWTPRAELYHHESATRGLETTPEKRARFQGEVEYMLHRWGPLLLNDSAYNPNLTLVAEDFSLAYVPRTARAWRHRHTASP